MTPRSALVLFGLLSVTTRLPAQPESFAPLPRPVVLIGREGDANYEFNHVWAAVRFPDGLIGVADRSPTIRIYDTTGRFLRTLGRDGSGPGEFRNVTRMFLSGDTLIVYDFRQRRLTSYLADGTLIGTQPVRFDAEERAGVIGRLSGGRWLVSMTMSMPNFAGPPGWYRDIDRIGWGGPAATGSVQWADSGPGLTLFRYLPSDQKKWAVGVPPLAANAVPAALGDSILFGDTKDADLRLVRLDGRLIRRIPLPVGPAVDLRSHRRAQTEQDVARERERGRDPAFEIAVGEAATPTARYQSLEVSAAGRLWIRLWPTTPSGPERYVVVSRTGSPLAWVTLPPKTRILSVQAPWILAVFANEDDVETVGLIRWDEP
ncbi:MAG: 6-bladed beta-propeller [Gemmatimonadales bacterium]